MRFLNQIICAGLIAIAGSAVLPTIASAAGDERAFGNGNTDFYKSMVSEYREYIAKMSPADRAKLMAMQDKLMQMEMDKQSTDMKMDMEIAKMKRDMQMMIISATTGR